MNPILLLVSLAVLLLLSLKPVKKVAPEVFIRLEDMFLYSTWFYFGHYYDREIDSPVLIISSCDSLQDRRLLPVKKEELALLLRNYLGIHEPTPGTVASPSRIRCMRVEEDLSGRHLVPLKSCSRSDCRAVSR